MNIKKLAGKAMVDAMHADSAVLANRYKSLLMEVIPGGWDQFESQGYSGVSVIRSAIARLMVHQNADNICMSVAAGRDLNRALDIAGAKFAMRYQQVILEVNPALWDQFKEGLLGGYEVVLSCAAILSVDPSDITDKGVIMQ
jgi:hypothetical protein